MVIGIHLASLHTLYCGSTETQTKCFSYFISSIRSSWPYGLSPGSLSSNDYWGHSFWDTETWMYPTLLMLYPEIARSLLLYRFQRMNAARENARSHNVSGRLTQVGQLSLSADKDRTRLHNATRFFLFSKVNKTVKGKKFCKICRPNSFNC